MSRLEDQRRLKRIPGLGLGVIILVVIMLTLMAIFSFSRTDETVFPSSQRFTPGGTAALAELLRADGYQVSFDLANHPVVKKNQLAIACIIAPEKPGILDILNSGDKPKPRAHVGFGEFIKEGGQGLVLHFPPHLDEAHAKVDETTTLTRTNRDSPPMKISDSGLTGGDFDLESTSEYGLFAKGTETFAEVRSLGKGRYVEVLDAVGALNRYLPKAQNAEFLLSLVHALARPGSSIVFTEATFGNIKNKGVLGELGSWAVAFQWQFILLLIVVAFTVGVRFGAPVWEPSRARSTRDMVDAVADVYRRSHRNAYSLEVMRADAVERVRIAVGAPQGSLESDFLRHTPPPLQEIFAELVQINPKIPSQDALKLATKLETAVTDFTETAKRRRMGTRI